MNARSDPKATIYMLMQLNKVFVLMLLTCRVNVYFFLLLIHHTLLELYIVCFIFKLLLGSFTDVTFIFYLTPTP